MTKLQCVALRGNDPLPAYVEAAFDGGCEPCNPGGVATIAWMIWGVEESGEMFRTFRAVLDAGGPKSTNNWAEMSAIGTLLRYLLELPEESRPKRINIYGDSKLAVNLTKGIWTGQKPHILKLAERCRELVRDLRKGGAQVKICWYERTSNTRTDALGREAYEEFIAGADDETVQRVNRGWYGRRSSREDD